MKWIAVLLASGLLTFAAEDPAPPPVETVLQTLRTELQTKIGKIDQALTAATKAGELKPAIEVYYRDCLSHFQTSPTGLSESERTYFPPRFDSSPAMEPINLAWADLRTEISRQQREQEKLLLRLQDALGDALTTAAETAERAADLTPASQTINLLETLAEATGPNTRQIVQGSPRQQITAARSLLKMMGDALEARSQKNEARQSAALKALENNDNLFSFARLPALGSAQEAFRARLLAPQLAEAAQMQARLEEAIMARRPAEELQALLSQYSGQIRQLQELSGREERSGRQRTDELLLLYHNNLNSLAILAAGQMEQMEPLARYEPLPLAHPAQYRAFFAQLREELTPRADGEVSAARAQALTAIRAEIAKRRSDARAKLGALETPAAAMALAETLAEFVPESRRDDRGEWQAFQQQLQMAGQQLQALAQAWQEESLTLTRPGEYRGDGAGGFGAELLALRERATRDTVSAKLQAPELKQPPLAAQPLRAGLRTLTEAAAERGDWKRAYALADALGGALAGVPGEEPIRPGGMGPATQAVSIGAYLTGLNFEQAEQFTQAIECYQRVLTDLSEHVPTAECTARLKKLRAAHPELFDRAAGRASSFAP